MVVILPYLKYIPPHTGNFLSQVATIIGNCDLFDHNSLPSSRSLRVAKVLYSLESDQSHCIIYLYRGGNFKRPNIIARKCRPTHARAESQVNNMAGINYRW